MKNCLLILCLSALLFVPGCSTKTTTNTDAKLRIVTTVGMITDIVQIIAGEYGEVTGLMGAGVDPHLYKASYSDVELLSRADVIFYNGLHLEGKMADVLEKMSKSKQVVAITDGIPRNGLRQPPEFEGHYDPHVWMVPELWVLTLDVIRDKLIELRPAHAEKFKTNTESLRRELNELQSWAINELNAIPADQRVLVTAHDAFGYFGDSFKLEVRGLQGISTATDYGLKDVTNLVDLLSQQSIKAVFVETSVPTKPLEAVIQGCKSRGHDVRIGGSLFSDAMGDAGTPEGTYLGMIRHNITTIASALK